MVPIIFREVFERDLEWKTDDDGSFDSLQKALLEHKSEELGLNPDLLMKLLEAERQSFGHARRSKIHIHIASILNEEWNPKRKFSMQNYRGSK